MNVISRRYINKILTVLFITIIIVSLGIFANNNTVNMVSTVSSFISNKKIEWGIKRGNNHSQPDVGYENKVLLENNNGICLGGTENKLIYLTFDEGYEAGYTTQILDILKNNNVKAAFFITAHYLNTQEELVKRMIAEGHIVGNHTVNHKSMPSLTDDKLRTEIMDLHTSIYQKFGYELKYIRPPKGEFSERTLAISTNLGYKTVMWSFAYEDWKEKEQPDEKEAKEKIVSNFHNGEIMLLHGNSKTNTNILEDIIKEGISEGYEFKALNEFEK